MCEMEHFIAGYSEVAPTLFKYRVKRKWKSKMSNLLYLLTNLYKAYMYTHRNLPTKLVITFR